MNTRFFMKSKSRFAGVLLGAALIFIAAMSLGSKQSHAACSITPQIIQEHVQGRLDIQGYILQDFLELENFIVNDFARQQVIPALQRFTEQMTIVAVQQTMAIGTFLDAKHQLETQRVFQELQVEAHKDYQPSTAFCAFGTNVRSLANSEAASKYNAVAIAQRQMARHLGTRGIVGAQSSEKDKVSRWDQFTEIYCDPADNNRRPGTPSTGLIENLICTPLASRSANDLHRVNIDIDYTRLIENRRTLDISRPQDYGSEDEIDTQALGNNLYGHKALFREINSRNLLNSDKPGLYLNLRSVAAKRSVAENSFNTIVGLKSSGNSTGIYGPPGTSTTVGGVTTGTPSPMNTFRFLGSVLTELGIPDDEVDQYLGIPYDSRRPNFSYYAQLEILSKKIFQNPDFYANLYDKPANVKRISAALKAIELMLDREIYESQLRQEMNLSVLLSSRLDGKFQDIQDKLQGQ